MTAPDEYDPSSDLEQRRVIGDAEHLRHLLAVLTAEEPIIEPYDRFELAVLLHEGAHHEEAAKVEDGREFDIKLALAAVTVMLHDE